MQSDHDDLWIKLHNSLEHLATGPGSLKRRLENVLISYLVPLAADSSRSDVARLISEVVTLATSKEDETGIVGHLHFTLSSSHWKTDKKMAEKIFQAYELASKAHYGEQECEVGSAPGLAVGNEAGLNPGALLTSLVGRSGCGGPGTLEEK
jgi:hypothetical protein